MAWSLIAVLCLFVLRRLLFIVAALLPPRRFPESKTQFSVLIAVAARDEELVLPRLLRSLEELCYPSALLSFVFVSDGSCDKTASILNTWCAHHPRRRVISSDTSMGKAASLNLALTAAADEDLFVVYDADVVVNRSSVARLAEAFGDPAVAAVSGCTMPLDNPSVPSACYAALEAWMHQFVNQSAIDRLDLSPQINGSHCAFRLEPLRKAGGFPQALSEDVEAGFRLNSEGWKSRFCPEAIVETPMPRTIADFWRQRRRWATGLFRSAERASRLENWLVVTGYADRLVFIAALALVAAHQLSWVWLVLYFIGPSLSISVALAKSGVDGKARLIASCLPMFCVDIAVTFISGIAAIFPNQPKWSPRHYM